MIKLLEQNVIDKIAAGEVIERPRSIVKELVENAIDANSTRITVEISDGGKTMIRVTDDGDGIAPDEVRLAFSRHATSKLRSAEDLTGIQSLGFRGEALSTIAAVTKTELITKTRDSIYGTKYIIEGGREVSLSETGAPDGTTIIARDIFYNTPARLKFLKTNMTEGSYISDLMMRFAMSHPEISMRLISGSKSIIETTGSGSLRDVIYSLYGRDITKNLIETEYNDRSITVRGFIGKPFISKGNRNFETYFINGRYIQSPVISRAIEEAYKTYIMQHRFPFTALFIELPPERCDVNIHPAKREFKYEDEKTLFSVLYHAVSEALRDKVMIPDFAADYGTGEQHYMPSDEKPLAQGELGSFTSNMTNPDAAHTKASAQSGSGHSAHESIGISRPRSGMDSYSILESLLPEDYREKLKLSRNEETVSQPEAVYTAENLGSGPEGSIRGGGSNETNINIGDQQTLRQPEYLSEKALPDHRIIGQVFKTYWITEYDGALYLMDQHAAHEKINYERFLKEFRDRRVETQMLYPPEVISLTPDEKAAVLGNLDKFIKAGFEIDDFGDRDIRISGVPSNLLGMSGRDIFTEFAGYLLDGADGVTEDIFVHKLATMGCKAAIKGNQEVSFEEAAHLIKELLTLDNPYTCPHGRPTIIKVSKQELDKKFKRIVD